MKLILGLGNPGKRYQRNRHNIGFLVIDNLADSRGIDLGENARFKAMIGEGVLGEDKIILAKPLAFMNASGEALRAISDFYKLAAADILIVHDDADMDFGKARLVQGASSGGHRGIDSLLQHGLADAWRLKLGVANEHRLPGQAIDFVLTDFLASEWEQLPILYDRIVSTIEDFVHERVKTDTFNWIE